MPWEDPSFSYRAQARLALQLIQQLGQRWGDLPNAAQDEMRGLLTKIRSDLREATGDVSPNAATAVWQANRMRGVALNRFLYACESSAALPDQLRETLLNAHQEGAIRGTIELGKPDARRIVDAIDAVIGPVVPIAAAPGPTSAETFSDPLGRARKLVDWFNKGWNAISIEVEDGVLEAMVRFGRRLQRAADTAEAEAAASDFLREIKSFAPAYALVADTAIFRGLGGGSGSTAASWEGVLNALLQHPLVEPLLADAREVASAPPDTGVIPKDVFLPGVTGASTGSGANDVASNPPGDQQSATKVPLHTFVDFPAEVSVFDQKIPLTVQFTIERREDSRVEGQMAVPFADLEKPEIVQVVCNAEGFKEETGVTTRMIEVYSSRDSQPAIFLLTPEDGVKAGTKRISLDCYHAGLLALSSSFDVELKDRPPLDRGATAGVKPLIPNEQFPVRASLVVTNPVVAIPDLVLRVVMSSDERELRFTLDSPSGRFVFRQSPMGRIRLPERKSPREFLESTYESLNEMAGSSIKNRPPDETESNRREIDEIGWNLYDQLFPQQLKEAWRVVQKARAGRTDASLLVLSDEPWIPWEMVHTTSADDAGAFVAEGFLCEQFRLSRWVAGRRMPEAIALTSALLVAPKSNLESVKKEKAYFAELAKTHPKVMMGERALERADEVKEAMAKEKARLYHFACHGTFEAENPDDSSLILVGKPLRPSEIIGPTQVGIDKSKPLVFLNACTSSAADMRLIGIGGWSKRFVDAGVTAFIGSLWEVNDLLAAEFAQAFYNGLILDKRPLGEAFYKARQVIKQMDPGNPTWLAYVLYAHPNGKVEVSA